MLAVYDIIGGLFGKTRELWCALSITLLVYIFTVLHFYTFFILIISFCNNYLIDFKSHLSSRIYSVTI